MASPTNEEATTNSNTPEGVARLVRVLTELAQVEVPSLTGYDGEWKTHVDVSNIDHPFGQAWRNTTRILEEHLNGLRVGKANLDSTDSNDMVHCRSTQRDSTSEVHCSVVQYTDGSRKITARYSTPTDWENQTFGTSESYEQTFIEVDRSESLAEQQIKAALENTPWGSR